MIWCPGYSSDWTSLFYHLAFGQRFWNFFWCKTFDSTYFLGFCHLVYGWNYRIVMFCRTVECTYLLWVTVSLYFVVKLKNVTWAGLFDHGTIISHLIRQTTNIIISMMNLTVFSPLCKKLIWLFYLFLYFDVQLQRSLIESHFWFVIASD